MKQRIQSSTKVGLSLKDEKVKIWRIDKNKTHKKAKAPKYPDAFL